MKKINNYASFIPTIKSLVPIKDAAERYGITFNKSGYAICPFHHEKTASFRIKDDFAHCFGCGWTGDVIGLVKSLFDLDINGAIERLNDDFGLGLPVRRRPTLREKRELERQKAEAQRRKEQQRIEQLIRDVYGFVQDHLWAEKFRLEDEIARYAPKNIDDEWDERFVSAVLAKERQDRLIDSFEAYTIDEIIAAGKSGEQTGTRNRGEAERSTRQYLAR